MAKPTTRTASQYFLSALAACGVALAGCRAVDNAQVDVMERDLRQQKAYIYELEEIVMQYSDKLRECRTCLPAVSETKATTSGRSSGGLPQPTLANDADDEPLPTPPRRVGNGTVPRTTTPRTPDMFEEAPTTPLEGTMPEATPESTPGAVDPETLVPPGLEIGSRERISREEAALAAAPPAVAAVPFDESPLVIPDPEDYQAVADESVENHADFAGDDLAAPQLVAATNADGGMASNLIAGNAPAPTLPVDPAPEVAPTLEPELPPPADPARLVATQLQIRYVLVSPSAESGGAPSLLAVVEALNATNEPVDANGAASIMVTRGETREALRQLDRWDFTAEETQAAWQSSQLGDGLHLELPLDDAALPDEPIFLWARLLTPDGTSLRTRVEFAPPQLQTLDAALAAINAAAQPGAAVEPQIATALATTPAAEVDGHAAVVEPPAPDPAKLWRAATQPVNPVLVQGYATTVAGSGASGWTAQPVGGRFPASQTPRVASAAASTIPTHWQQGSAPAPANDNGAWAAQR